MYSTYKFMCFPILGLCNSFYNMYTIVQSADSSLRFSINILLLLVCTVFFSLYAAYVLLSAVVQAICDVDFLLCAVVLSLCNVDISDTVADVHLLRVALCVLLCIVQLNVCVFQNCVCAMFK